MSIDPAVPLLKVGYSKPANGCINRLQWTHFAETIPKLCGKTLADIPLIKDSAYVRELLQYAVMDDLRGPANGPNELIKDMSVRDRYLVGKLAPRETLDEGNDWGNSAVDEAEDVVPDDLEVKAKPAPPTAGKRTKAGEQPKDEEALGKGEPETSDEIDVSKNQSLVPSSFGMTFCVDGEAERIEVEARWGRYERLHDHGITKTRKKKNKKTGKEEEIEVKVWQRIPCGGKMVLDLKQGPVSRRSPDPDNPEVIVQGSIRGRNENGDRLVTLFLVNGQEALDTNKDSAWLFQPELIVRTTSENEERAIFRRRSVPNEKIEPERAALEMVYRKQVEFGVGHGVAVHSEASPDNLEWATEIRSVIMPQYEVPVTETPGLDPRDRPAMREMIEKGYLDMDLLAGMERKELVDALSILVDDYAAWIDEQRARVGSDMMGHDDQACVAMDRCEEILQRLREGLGVLGDETDETALRAFRLANRAMARQRIHSIYALAHRRGEKRQLKDYDERKNRSWRPFQLAFVLLSIPSLADPLHKDRTRPIEAYADLIWFPTGGGKTEAYLGVAAFTMFIRRLQGNLGGYDSSRGLAVIMRYTLRLLTLQQFQRATALICAMEVLRREALDRGDESPGTSPFTIGLWVGNRVTPGTTEDSHRAIEDFRDPSKWNAGSSSPAQLTSCPWCGTEVDPGKDIEVDKARLRTSIFCGNRRCEFSRGRSSDQAHPGIPAVVVDEEIYHRPPSMMIATVDKFAMMAWRGETRTLFGIATGECPRHGLLWPEASCAGNHRADTKHGLPKTNVENISPIRPPDLIIQDEFHLISGPLGTMVGLYETAVDELCTWKLDDQEITPKTVASTATVRKAGAQVHNVFMRRVSIFPPHGLDIEDNFFSVQRSIADRPGRRYLGVCSPGSSRPAMLIRVYTAFLTAAQALFDRFGQAADPYLTMVGYFNSLRELGGMKRLAEDDVQTRSYRVQMSLVDRPGLAQRSVYNIKELTSRVSSQDIPKYLDQLEVKFNASYDSEKEAYVTRWDENEMRAIDVLLATNMLSVGVDVNRLGLMAVNGQPKGTAEYIQATSRVGRQFPGLVCSVLTWARPRDLSHYETFEHYHATFYKHVEAQSVTPFSPRAMDRGLTGTMLSILRLENDLFNPNKGASELDETDGEEIEKVIDVVSDRAWRIKSTDIKGTDTKDLAIQELKERIDEWAKEASVGGRILAYERKGQGK
ncbi:DISARM system helicase DrmA, partial [Thiolapillus sp.]|uniref:DISARM system helicase DrmA n=1 Tax=Thiolapillus sp. TaxID=2017437 RepID=UPI003AF5F6D0